MKKLVAFALSLALLLQYPFSGALAVTIEDPEALFPAVRRYEDFSDVPSDAWYASYVKVCCETGLMNGTGGEHFSPMAELSVVEMEALAARLHHILGGGDGVLPKAPAGTGSIRFSLPDGRPLTVPYGKGTEAGVQPHGFAIYLNRTDWEALGSPETLTALVDGRYQFTGTQAAFEQNAGNITFLFPVTGAEFAQCDPAARLFGDRVPDAWYWDADLYLKAIPGAASAQSETLMYNTRGQFLALLGLVCPDALLAPINTIQALPDTNDETVLRFYNAGILNGVDSFATFDQWGTLTRAEAAAMLARIIRPGLRLSFSLENAPYALNAMDVDTKRYNIRNFASDYIYSSTPTDAYGYLYLQETLSGRAGVMDQDGAWVISPDEGYDGVAFFCADGIAAASREHKWGYIDLEGNTVIPFEYDFVSHLHDGFVLGGNWHGGGYDVYRADGTLLRTLPAATGDYVSLNVFDVAGGLIPFSETNDPDTKMGYLNPDGTVALAAQWHDAKPFSDGLAAVLNGPRPLKTVNDNGSRYGLIDKEGTLAIPYRYPPNSYPPVFHDGVAYSFLGWICKDGTLLSESAENPLPADWYTAIYPPDAGAAQYVDRDFNPVTPPLFTSSSPAGNGGAWVVREEQLFRLTFPLGTAE